VAVFANGLAVLKIVTAAAAMILIYRHGKHLLAEI